MKLRGCPFTWPHHYREHWSHLTTPAVAALTVWRVLGGNPPHFCIHIEYSEGSVRFWPCRLYFLEKKTLCFNNCASASDLKITLSVIYSGISDDRVPLCLFSCFLFGLLPPEIAAKRFESVSIKQTDRLLVIWQRTWMWYGIPGYFAVFSVFPQWQQNRSFVYIGRNKHKQADRFVLKPHGTERQEMPFYRFAAVVLFFPRCPSPRCFTVRHLIEGLAVSYQ